jgi:hypothetical protein
LVAKCRNTKIPGERWLWGSVIVLIAFAAPVNAQFVKKTV